MPGQTAYLSLRAALTRSPRSPLSNLTDYHSGNCCRGMDGWAKLAPKRLTFDASSAKGPMQWSKASGR